MSLKAVILAAGKGTRMRSTLPKVLHPVAGQPMLARVIQTARQATGTDPVVVYGHGGDQLRSAIGDTGVDWVEQSEQLGTGHAVAQALPALLGASRVLVLYGDVPLLEVDTLSKMLATLGDSDEHAVVLTARLDDPTGYGRIVRDEQGHIVRIVEQKDADPATLAINEINTGIMLLPGARLSNWLSRINNQNAQGEYYLTDVVGLGQLDDVRFHALVVDDPDEVAGVNDRVQLATLERALQRRQAEALMRGGATLADPNRIDIRGNLVCGTDVNIDVGCVFEGEVFLGDGVRVGANCVLRDCRIEAGASILPMSMIDGATLQTDAQVGPFARIRPGTKLASGSRIGNFVEVKNASIGIGSKVNHLSYIGDAEVGASVNIGAGTITCNYDGANKHRTVIGDDVFVGSDTQLVAPVCVGGGATVAAGTTVTADVPEGGLVLSRVRQHHLPRWQRPTKAPKKPD